jgi:hypothetical protein
MLFEIREIPLEFLIFSLFSSLYFSLRPKSCKISLFLIVNSLCRSQVTNMKNHKIKLFNFLSASSRKKIHKRKNYFFLYLLHKVLKKNWRNKIYLSERVSVCPVKLHEQQRTVWAVQPTSARCTHEMKKEKNIKWFVDVFQLVSWWSFFFSFCEGEGFPTQRNPTSPLMGHKSNQKPRATNSFNT